MTLTFFSNNRADALQCNGLLDETRERFKESIGHCTREAHSRAAVR